MIVRNRRNDLMYKKDNEIVMVHERLNVDVDTRIMHSLITSFENGIDVEYIIELMEPKGWTKESLYGIVKQLLDIGFIEDATSYVDGNKMKAEFEKFKNSILDL